MNNCENFLTELTSELNKINHTIVNTLYYNNYCFAVITNNYFITFGNGNVPCICFTESKLDITKYTQLKKYIKNADIPWQVIHSIDRCETDIKNNTRLVKRIIDYIAPLLE
jgi:hypothetical protein